MNRILASFIACVVLAQCTDAPVTPTVATGGDRVEYHDERHNLDVSYPDDWSRAEEQLTILGNPNEVLALATFPLDKGGGCAPKIALRDADGDDAIVFLMESTATTGRKPGPRPHSFAPLRKAKMSDCWDVPVSTYHFRDAGGRFQADVWLGPRATPETRDEVVAILDSLRFGTRDHISSFFDRARTLIRQRRFAVLRRASGQEKAKAAPVRELRARVRRRLAREAPGARMIEVTLGIFISKSPKLGHYRKLAYVLHTGPFGTGDCLDIYDAKTLEYDLGSCFITDREL